LGIQIFDLSHGGEPDASGGTVGGGEGVGAHLFHRDWADPAEQDVDFT
jgi:hypothetical protein